MSMAAAIVTEDTPTVAAFAAKTKKSFDTYGKTGFVANSKIRYIQTFEPKRSLIIVSCDEYIAFKPAWLGVPLLIVVYLFFGWHWLLAIPVFITLIHFFCTNTFLYYITVLSLRRNGYKGMYRRLSNAYLVGRFVNGTK